MEDERVLIAGAESGGRPGDIDRSVVRRDRHAIPGLIDLAVKLFVEGQAAIRTQREEYSADIDILHLASEMVIDAVIEPDTLRDEMIRRFAMAEDRDRSFTERRNPITPA